MRPGKDGRGRAITRPVRIIGFLLLAAGLLIGGLWAYRSVGPRISQDQAEQAALNVAEQSGVTGSVVIQSRFSPDGRVSPYPGSSVEVQVSGCPSQVPLPVGICPPAPLWLITVHTWGRPDQTYRIDANTGGEIAS